jgi:hypothetical protein
LAFGVRGFFVEVVETYAQVQQTMATARGE